MAKNCFLVGIVLLVVSLMVVGCGVSQEKYDDVLAERNAAQAEVTSLQSKFDDATRDLAALESDLNIAQGQIDSLESSLSATQSEMSNMKSEIAAVWNSLNGKLSVRLAILDYWNDAIKLDTGEITMEEFLTDSTIRFMTDMSAYIVAVGDTELSQLWEDFLYYAAMFEYTDMMTSLANLTDLINDLVEQDIKSIDAML